MRRQIGLLPMDRALYSLVCSFIGQVGQPVSGHYVPDNILPDILPISKGNNFLLEIHPPSRVVGNLVCYDNCIMFFSAAYV